MQVMSTQQMRLVSRWKGQVAKNRPALSRDCVYNGCEKDKQTRWLFLGIQSLTEPENGFMEHSNQNNHRLDA